MTDRFDLEQQILECWKVTDDISTVFEYSDAASMDENFKALKKFTELRFEKLWHIFEQMCHENQFVDMRSQNSSTEA